MKLHELSPAQGSRKSKKRLGKGVGSGAGKTAGRGTKGQKSRSGAGPRLGFEGGQMPMQRRLPKRGFRNIFRKQYAVINIQDLERFEKDAIVDKVSLSKIGLVKGKNDGIKLLGKGDLAYPLTIKVDKISKRAREKIVAAGGRIEE
jgi:large subunit ribosomal protein L15